MKADGEDEKVDFGVYGPVSCGQQLLERTLLSDHATTLRYLGKFLREYNL